MTKVTNIAKNTSYFTFALILQKVISFAYFTLLARTFIPDDLGKYFFAISLTSIFSIFIDLNQSNVLTREIAKSPEDASVYLSAITIMKIPLTILSFAALFVTVNILHYPELTKQLVYISSICMILDTFTTNNYSCLRGFHNLKYESIGSIFFQVVVFILGLISIKLKLDLHFLILGLAIGSIVNFCYSIYLIIFVKKIKFVFKFDPVFYKHIIMISVPFAIFGIYQKVYMYLDTVLLSALAGDKAAGLYQIAFKIIFALQFLPMAFTASLYPAFSTYWKHNREQLATTFERAMNYLIIISLPISVGTIFLADRILKIFKPEYIEAKLSLQIIMASLIFIFINFPIGSLLNACDRQKTNTNNMGLVLLASVVLNLILIPKFQVVGASITVLLTNILMFVLSVVIIPKITTIHLNKIYPVFFKSIIAAIIMAGLILIIKTRLNIIILIGLSGILYFAVLFILKAFQKEDIFSIYKSFKKS